MSDIPILLRHGVVPGAGPRVEWASKASVGGTFAAEKARRAKFDVTCARGIGLVLHNHYRGHFWLVEVDSHQGYCAITIPILLGNWKWKIPLADLTPAMVIKAGGEILERFKIPRSALDLPSFIEARKRRVSRASQLPPS